MAKKYFTLVVLFLVGALATSGWAQSTNANGQSTNLCGPVEGGASTCPGSTYQTSGTWVAFGDGMATVDVAGFASSYGVGSSTVQDTGDTSPGGGLMNSTGAFGAIRNFAGNFFQSQVQAWHDNYNSNHVAAGIDNVQQSLRAMSQGDPLTRNLNFVLGMSGGGESDPFLKPCPQCGHIFQEARPAAGEVIGTVGPHSSWRIEGGFLERFGDKGAFGGKSFYEKVDGVNSGAWRTSDHTFDLPRGLSADRAIDEFGGLPGSLYNPNDSLWIFTKKPVTTFYNYPK